MIARVCSLLAIAALWSMCAITVPVAPAFAATTTLSAAQRSVLDRYLAALRAGNYPAAFALLAREERAYFENATNFGSIFRADRLALQTYRILGARAATNGARGAVVFVAERVRFFDAAHDATGTISANIPYAVVAENGGWAIKDPYHPWRALVPQDWSATKHGVTVAVRKVSFFAGRVELLLTFSNRGASTVTLLPYGRSVLRDDENHVHQPIESRYASLTDAALYREPRLVPGAQITGALTFPTASRFTPRSLSATIGPFVADGADEPFSIDLPSYAIPN